MTKESLVGTWKLVSCTTTTDKGVVNDPMGSHPTGFLTYTADGRVSVVIAYDGRKPVSTYPPPAQELVDAFNTFSAYAGTYSLDGDRVIHRIKASWIEDFVNTDQVRIVKLQGARLTLRGGWLVGGVMYAPNSELVWEQLTPRTADK